MLKPMQESIEREYEELRQFFNAPLRAIAKRSVRLWFHRDRLDRLLADSIGSLKDCELVYAIDVNGRQVSSNIHPASIDFTAYGQDLSRRPYAVNLSLLNDAAFHGAFLCHAYTSQVTQRPCVTVMHGVTSGSSSLGYIAVDLNPAVFPWATPEVLHS